MTYVIASRRAGAASLQRRFSDAALIDVTSQGPEPWLRFSPFYPHGEIPVPLSPGHTAASVEGIWQGLKVFERADVDLSKLSNATMRGLIPIRVPAYNFAGRCSAAEHDIRFYTRTRIGIKRSTRSLGAVRGHRAGIAGTELLAYAEARRRIYLPAYRYILDQRLQAELNTLRQLSAAQPIVLLDYETNTNIDDLSRPLSHAGLIVRYLEGAWPTIEA